MTEQRVESLAASTEGPSAAFDTSAPGEIRISRALLSVSDKTGLVEFARGLAELGIEIVSTGGTARSLSEAGLSVREVSELTGFPEIMDGRVKTLHPKLHAALLARRDEPAHLRAAEEHEVELVDLVCVNLYPFERTVARPEASERETIENIDIGGPTMIRAAAKNFAFVAPVVRPESYGEVLAELRQSDRRLSLATRERLAAEAFACTARYDAAIAGWFEQRGERFPPTISRSFERVLELRYGENPHQGAAYYARAGARTHLLAGISQLGGKQLTFNNLLDLDAARRLAGEFDDPCCVIIKHNNPCGVALGDTPLEAYQRAFACDPVSAYGGVICLNRGVDQELAEALVGQFVEVLLAPGYGEEALEVLTRKPNMRILDDRERGAGDARELELQHVSGGMLIQDRDFGPDDAEAMQVVTARAPSEEEWRDLLFAWSVCKHVRSNAIVLSSGRATVGIGAGQMSRVDSVQLALEKARSDLIGAVMASDAFFPFPDGPQLALQAGVNAIIQPGGSVRDNEVVEAVDAAGAAMVFTGRRHFRH